MIFLADINVFGPGLRAGSCDTWEDFISLTSGASEYQALRHIVTEVLAGRAALVTSEPFLVTLEMTLLRGGSDFAAFDTEGAARMVTMVRALSLRTGTYFTKAHVKAQMPTAKSVCKPFYNVGTYPIDHEDVVVVATALASMSTSAQGIQVVLVTNDKGLTIGGIFPLVKAGIAPIGSAPWASTKFRMPGNVAAA